MWDFYSRCLISIFPSGFSANLSSFWGRHFWVFCFFCQRSWWTEWQAYLWFIVSNSEWLHVWSLLSVFIVRLYPKRLLWNLFYHWNQCSSPILTYGYSCSFTSSWIFLDVTCTSSVWCLFSEILLLASLCPSLVLAEYFPLSFLTTSAKISFYVFLPCVPFETALILLRSANICLSQRICRLYECSFLRQSMSFCLNSGLYFMCRMSLWIRDEIWNIFLSSISECHGCLYRAVSTRQK